MTASSSKIDIFIISREVLTKASWISLHGWKDETYFSFACQFFFFFKTRSQISFGASVFQQQLAKKKKKASASLKSHLEKCGTQICRGETEWVQTKAANMLDTGTFGWAGKSALHSELTVSARSRLIRAISASFCMSLMHVWCNSGQEASNPSPWHIYCNGWYDMNRNKRWDWGGCRALCCFGGWK